ncbi:hypothetical protein ACIPW9_37030 [Streptomyces sp. NPDC090052]|uniref:hypothetical protein n=1 Tax=Streptomyces sp. NPDC090052 TaxID=3365931 RepID=UPI00380DBA89
MTEVEEPSPTPVPDWWDRLYAEAGTAPVAPAPAKFPQKSRLGDWWQRRDVLEDDRQADDLEDVDVDVEPEAADATGPESDVDVEPEPGAERDSAGRWLRPVPGYYPPPSVPAALRAPRVALSPGTRRLLANIGAGGAGYLFGLTPLLGGWIEDCGRSTSIGGALVLGGGMCLALAHFWDRRTRHWWPGLAWAARIPLMSAITALALYAPASQV